jgi:lysophospholipase L1-like esterase
MPVADVYIIALGTNDHAFNRSLGTISDTSATDTYYGDMQELQEKLLVLNPDAKFIFITNARRGTSADTTEWNTTTSLWLEQFADATVAFALKNNHGYLDLYKYSNANPQRSVINTNYYVGADATHLNNNGHSLFYYPLVTTLIKKYLR